MRFGPKSPDTARYLLLLRVKSRGTALAFDDLPDGEEKFKSETLTGPDDISLRLDAVVSSHIRRVLEIADGRVHGKGGAAKLLGINPSTLRYRMNQMVIPYGRKSAR